MRSFILLTIASAMTLCVWSGAACARGAAMHVQQLAQEERGQGAGAPMGTLGQAQAPYVHGSLLASDLIGQTVENYEGQNLGKLRTLLIDKSGQIRYGVLEEDGSVWGEGESYMVPWDRFSIDANDANKRIRVNVGLQELPSQFRTFEPGEDNERKSPSGGETGGAIG